jgi:hypothetical protein
MDPCPRSARRGGREATLAPTAVPSPKPEPRHWTLRPDPKGSCASPHIEDGLLLVAIRGNYLGRRGLARAGVAPGLHTSGASSRCQTSYGDGSRGGAGRAPRAVTPPRDQAPAPEPPSRPWAPALRGLVRRPSNGREHRGLVRYWRCAIARCGGAGASCLGGMRARPSRSACRGICVCRTLTHQTNASGCLFYTARRGGRWEVARHARPSQPRLELRTAPSYPTGALPEREPTGKAHPK